MMRRITMAAALAAACGVALAGPTTKSGTRPTKQRVAPGIHLPTTDGVFSENFDSYANGSGIIGQGGWQGWAAGAIDGTVNNTLSSSAPNSLLAAVETDVVQLFNLSSGQYTFKAMTYIPSTQIGDGFCIILNTWTGGGGFWSLQIHFNTSTILSDFGGQTTPAITDQWVELRAEIDLDADLLDVYYNNTQFVFDAIWSLNVSGAGTATIQALDLYSQAAGFRWDDVSIEEAGGCYPDCNGDDILNLADFGCFQTAFAGGNMYADCNLDQILNLADFGCFQTAFAQGCP